MLHELRRDVAVSGQSRLSPLEFRDRRDIFILNIQRQKMASTSLSLGTHWEKFVKREIASGRYASASEVVRAALRELEERGKRLKALQDHLAEGVEQARNGEFVEFSVDDVLKRAKKRAAKRDKA